MSKLSDFVAIRATVIVKRDSIGLLISPASKISQRQMVECRECISSALDDHMHDFDATQNDAGTAKIFESQRWTGATLDGTVVL
ncbi:hypothetical protein QFZ97_007204 [Paraburkholderia youngii]